MLVHYTSPVFTAPINISCASTMASASPSAISHVSISWGRSTAARNGPPAKQRVLNAVIRGLRSPRPRKFPFQQARIFRRFIPDQTPHCKTCRNHHFISGTLDRIIPIRLECTFSGGIEPRSIIFYKRYIGNDRADNVYVFATLSASNCIISQLSTERFDRIVGAYDFATCFPRVLPEISQRTTREIIRRHGRFSIVIASRSNASRLCALITRLCDVSAI